MRTIVKIVLGVAVLAAVGAAAVSVACAADLDPRAELTVLLSPMECLGVYGRVRAKKIESEAESDALARIGKACEFSKITEKVKGAKRDERGNPIIPDSMFAGPRAPRKIPRDALEQLVTWISPGKDTGALDAAQDEVFRPIRAELREVLAGRDPYGV